MRNYTFNVGGVRVTLRAAPEEASLFTWCLVTAFQTLRKTGGGKRPSPAEIIKKATSLRLGMQMGQSMGRNMEGEGVSNYVH